MLTPIVATFAIFTVAACVPIPLRYDSTNVMSGPRLDRQRTRIVFTMAAVAAACVWAAYGVLAAAS